tara:strand:+ start:153 stop:1859 length:1707 start_codon:yes stop_codon:yes gene_type:complete
MILTAFFNIISVLGLMPIVDYVTDPSLNSDNRITLELIKIYENYRIEPGLITFGLFYLFTVILKASIFVFEKFITVKTIVRIMRELIFDQYKSYLDASWEFFGTKDYGTLSNTIAKEIEKAVTGLESLAQFCASSFALIFYFILLVFISWDLTLMVFFITALILLPVSFLLNKYVYKVRKIHTNASNVFQGKIYDTLNSMKLILGFAKKEETFNELKPTVFTVTRTAIQFTMARIIMQPLTEILVVVLIISSIVYGLGYVEIGIPSLIAFLYSIQRLGTEAQAVMNSRNGISASLPSFEQIDILKDEAFEKKERKGGIQIVNFEKSIHIKNLVFGYDKVNKVLNNVSMEINKGSMVGIVGPSGSGKSSLVDLILGFYPQDKGRIEVDDTELQDLDLIRWRDLIGYIPQQPFLFNLSLKDNMLWANPNASDEDILEAFELANATDFVENLDNGFNTIVGERGARLSGGQAQRICLARAIVKRPQILILDEATSSLDSNSEMLIQKSIEQLSGKITIISIAHRLGTIKKADVIYNLVNGMIEESGNFETLMSNTDGNFYNTAQQQGIKEN